MPPLKVHCAHCNKLVTPAVARRHLRLYSTPQLQYLQRRNHLASTSNIPNTPATSEDVTDYTVTPDYPQDHLDEIDILHNIRNTTWHSSMRRASAEDDEDEDEETGIGPFVEEDDEDVPETAPVTELSTDDLEELSVYEQLAESFERNSVDLDQLSPQDRAILRAYAFKIRSRLTLEAFKMLPFAFEGISVESVDEINSRAAFLSGLDPILYHCCPNSCCLYVGPHSELSECPFCHEPRYNARKRPRKVFTYIPLIPRLTQLFKNANTRHKLDYRATFKISPSRECGQHGGRKCYCPSRITDIFDGEHYRTLLDTAVTVNGRKLIHAYFSDLRDIALGFSTDGFSPFKRRKHTAWPLIIYNLNLPPEERFHKDNIICIGVIPGPKKPHDFDSFLWPLTEELVRLSYGVAAYDIVKQEIFSLHAYLIFGAGDIPAMSMVMRMKGHNALKPCRMCEISGVRIPNNPRSKTHYVPINRSRHPHIQSDTDAISRYDPRNLPLRTHSRFLEQACEVQLSSSRTEEERLSKTYGIKGMPLLACLGSLSFPKSFPYDFMHLFWANVLQNLVRHWTGEYKDLNEGSGSYRLQPTVWEAIGKACAESGASIPTAYGARPMDINRERHLFNCDMWSFWTLYLAPVLLHNRFLEPRYYKHFVELVKLLNLCLKFEISTEELDSLQEGFVKWVERYEELYYQNSPSRVSACPLTIHAILHVPDGIKAMGPVWVYWAFPMERFCGRLQPHIKSRRFPFANIDSFVLADARLTHLGIKFDITQELSLKPVKNQIQHQEYVHPSYPSTVLAPPKRTGITDQSLLNRIAVCLATRYTLSMRNARSIIGAAELELFGRVRHLEGGDTMYASGMSCGLTDDRRDATFVRYELLVDMFAHRRNVQPNFRLDTFYGQLTHVIVVHLHSGMIPDIPHNETLLLADIHSVKIECKNDLDMHYYSHMGQREVVDMSCVQCLVGRVKVPTQTGMRWAIIDRSGELARALYVENET